MRARPLIPLLGLVCAAALVACGATPDPAADPASCQGRDRQLTIATGTANGVYAALGGALATQLAGSTQLTAKAVETSSTLRNVQQLATGEYDIAFAQADGATDAVDGQGVFAEPQKIQALARIYSDYTHVVVRADSGITSMADFRGKRISTGSPQSGTELVADRLLTAAGLDPRVDVQAQSLDLATTVSALEAGRLDGFVWSGGLPTGGVSTLVSQAGSGIRFLDVSALLPDLRKIDESYVAGTIPAAAYGLPADVPTISMANLLVVRDDFDESDACAVTTTLFRQKAALTAAVPAASGLDPTLAADTGPIPLNPGSAAALKALGS
jgi:uncharacterized protein